MIPDEALKNHIGILAKTGAGKTVAAKGIAEILMARGQRILALDPTAAWWGLRLMADGKTPGFPVVIFGGQHADVPLSPVMGWKVAEIITAGNFSAVVDVSQFTTDGRTQFFTDFAEALFVSNRRPLNVFIDEAHLFMPQQKLPTKASAKMTMAGNHLVSGGRSRGLRITLITQRPAKLHKDSLTQVETLVAMRLIAPHDIAAIDSWVANWADTKKASEIKSTLSSMPVGEGWVWAPDFGVLERTKFPMISTFDSSRAPEVDESLPAPAELAQVAIEEIRRLLDGGGRVAPSKRQESSTAELEIASRNATRAGYESGVVVERERAAQEKIEALTKARAEEYALGYVDGYKAAMVKAQHAFREVTRELVATKEQTEGVLSVIGHWLHDALTIPPTQVNTAPAPPVAQRKSASNPITARAEPDGIQVAAGSNPVGGAGLSNSQRRVMTAVAFWKQLDQEQPTREQVAAVAGYKPSSGGFNNLIGSLRTMGLLTIPTPGRVMLAGTWSHGMTMDVARNRLIFDVMTGAQRKLFHSASENHPTPISRPNLAKATGYAPDSGGFNNLVGQLCTLDIFRKPEPGKVGLSDWVADLTKGLYA